MVSIHYQCCGHCNQLLMYNHYHRTYSVHLIQCIANYLTSTLLTPFIVHPCHSVPPHSILHHTSSATATIRHSTHVIFL